MSGIPGSGGPVPKRTEERRRTNNENGQMSVDRAPGAAHVAVPEPDTSWHPIALNWYRSLAESGQSIYYEPSDWAVAQYIAEAMSRNLEQEKFSAMLVATVISGMTELLVTEGSRRRLRLELQRGTAVDDDEVAAVAAMDDYRKRLKNG